MDCQLDKNYILILCRNNIKNFSKVIKKKHPEFFEVVNKIPGDSLSEKIWLWLHDQSKAVCNHQSCQNKTKFLDLNRGYREFCSVACSRNSQHVKDKIKSTLNQKYGVDHYSKTNLYKQKFKLTLLDRYGVENPGQIESIKKNRSREKQNTFWQNFLEKIKETTTPNFDFAHYTHVRDKHLSWHCRGCDNDFESNIFGKLPLCPSCYPLGNNGGPSSVELELVEEIKKFYQGQIILNSREIIKPKELDIFFPVEKFAIELNGLYWHSSNFVEKSYHYEKYKLCDNLNIRLLMITDLEWNSNKELILSMIKHRLNLSKDRNSARQCSVQEIGKQQGAEFLKKYHIGGDANATGYVGLFHNDSLVSVMSYMKNRFTKNQNDIEIIRLAFRQSVAGALGKFVKFLQKKFPNQNITTYADLRYGSGNVYVKNGFDFVKTTKPGYWYFYQNKMYHRLSWTKKKLIKLGYDSTLTEEEIMGNLGALKIYDCGHNYFILRNNNG
jgi:hypothetical protein